LITKAFKIAAVGASGVGKSAMVRRLVQGTFPEKSFSTIGPELLKYVIRINDDRVQLDIWDASGRELYKPVTHPYIRNSIGAVLVYDITSDSSFDDLSLWLRDLRELCDQNVCILLVGNKADLECKRSVGREQAQDFADKHNLDYIETSALSGTNVTEAFTKLAFAIAKKVSSGEITLPREDLELDPFECEYRSRWNLSECARC
jgi:small GTP-binding protein